MKVIILCISLDTDFYFRERKKCSILENLKGQRAERKFTLNSKAFPVIEELRRGTLYFENERIVKGLKILKKRIKGSGWQYSIFFTLSRNPTKRSKPTKN